MLKGVGQISLEPASFPPGQEQGQSQAESQPEPETGHDGGEGIAMHDLDDRTLGVFKSRIRFMLLMSTLRGPSPSIFEVS